MLVPCMKELIHERRGRKKKLTLLILSVSQQRGRMDWNGRPRDARHSCSLPYNEGAISYGSHLLT